MITWNVIRSGLLTMIKSWTERDSSRNEDRNDYLFVCLMVFNDTFNNISVISWRPVVVVEEAGVPGENHRPWASNW
jgi:hypothetical protein